MGRRSGLRRRRDDRDLAHVLPSDGRGEGPSDLGPAREGGDGEGGRQHPFAHGAIKGELADVVDDNVRVDVPDLGISTTGRQKVVEKAAQAGVVFTSADCELTNTKIAIDAAETTAKVDAVALFTGVRGAERRLDRRDVHFLLRNDGGWKVTTIDVRAVD